MPLNGKPCSFTEPVSLKTLLSEEGFQLDRIAVMVNGEIVARGNLDKISVSAEDEIEIVSFVGGG